MKKSQKGIVSKLMKDVQEAQEKYFELESNAYNELVRLWFTVDEEEHVHHIKSPEDMELRGYDPLIYKDIWYRFDGMRLVDPNQIPTVFLVDLGTNETIEVTYDEWMDYGGSNWPIPYMIFAAAEHLGYYNEENV